MTTCNGPFTQNVSVCISASAHANPKAKLGPEPIHSTALAFMLTLTLCVNRIIHNANTPSKK